MQYQVRAMRTKNKTPNDMHSHIGYRVTFRFESQSSGFRVTLHHTIDL